MHMQIELKVAISTSAPLTAFSDGSVGTTTMLPTAGSSSRASGVTFLLMSCSLAWVYPDRMMQSSSVHTNSSQWSINLYIHAVFTAYTATVD